MSTLLGIISLLLLFPLITCNIYTIESESKPLRPINTIKTIGSASASIKPDQVSLSFSMTSLAKTASQALAENNEILKGAIINLKAANLKEEEIGTSSFSIGPAYDNVYFNNGTSSNVFKGYQVSSSLIVLSKKIELAGSLVDTVIKSGVKQVNSVEFQISNEKRKELQDQLLTQAVKNAKEKADLALEPLKARVNGLVSLDLASTQPQRYYPKALNRAVAYDAIESTNLHASNQDIIVEVTAVFEIGQGIDVSSVFP